jgi:hypothetical protein
MAEMGLVAQTSEAEELEGGRRDGEDALEENDSCVARVGLRDARPCGKTRGRGGLQTLVVKVLLDYGPCFYNLEKQI